MYGKMHHGKDEVVSFVMEYGRKIAIVKFEKNVRKGDRGSCFCVSFISSSLENISEIQLAKCGLSIDRAPSTYLNGM